MRSEERIWKALAWSLVMIVLVAVSRLFAQTQVSINAACPQPECQTLNFYDGGGNLEYVCTTKAVQRRPSTLSVTAATNASPAVLTVTAHGFSTLMSPAITISGATGNWTPINGKSKATVINTNTFSIPVNSTTFGALTGTVRLDTWAPRTSDPIWHIVKLTYNGSNQLTAKLTVEGGNGQGAVCDSRTTLAYQ